jgi:hypothetical protein
MRVLIDAMSGNNICCHTQQIIIKYGEKNSGRKWNLASDDTIFAENEAFIQRCKD